jgi:hypothetical protein
MTRTLVISPLASTATRMFTNSTSTSRPLAAAGQSQRQARVGCPTGRACWRGAAVPGARTAGHAGARPRCCVNCARAGARAGRDAARVDLARARDHREVERLCCGGVCGGLHHLSGRCGCGGRGLGRRRGARPAARLPLGLAARQRCGGPQRTLGRRGQRLDRGSWWHWDLARHRHAHGGRAATASAGLGGGSMALAQPTPRCTASPTTSAKPVTRRGGPLRPESTMPAMLGAARRRCEAASSDGSSRRVFTWTPCPPRVDAHSRSARRGAVRRTPRGSGRLR